MGALAPAYRLVCRRRARRPHVGGSGPANDSDPAGRAERARGPASGRPRRRAGLRRAPRRRRGAADGTDMRPAARRRTLRRHAHHLRGRRRAATAGGVPGGRDHRRLRLRDRPKQRRAGGGDGARAPGVHDVGRPVGARACPSRRCHAGPLDRPRHPDQRATARHPRTRSANRRRCAQAVGRDANDRRAHRHRSGWPTGARPARRRAARPGCRHHWRREVGAAASPRGVARRGEPAGRDDVPARGLQGRGGVRGVRRPAAYRRPGHRPGRGTDRAGARVVDRRAAPARGRHSAPPAPRTSRRTPPRAAWPGRSPDW